MFHNNMRIYLKSDNHVGYRLKLLNAFLSKLDNRSKFSDERFFIRKKLTIFKQIQINFITAQYDKMKIIIFYP